MLIKRLEVTLHHTPPAVTSLLSGMKTTLCQVLISQFQETSMTFRETVLSLKLDQEMTLTMTSELMLIKKTRGYASPYTTSGNFSPFWDENHIMPGTHITIPRDEHHIMRNSALMQKSRREPYSNELANGDKSDDKELEKENDPNDFAVDLHGHTDRGYGSEVPSDYFDKNHIMPGTHITIPRDETAHDLGNNVRA